MGEEMKTIDEHETEDRIAMLRKIPETISNLEKELREKDNIKQELEQKRNTVYMKLTAKVLAEKDEEGKPKYTNEQQRRIAVSLEKEKYKELIHLVKNHNENKEYINEITIKLSYYSNIMRIESIIAQMKN